jgi:capsule biosynthesis phosphatase
MDLDGTITREDPSREYRTLEPNKEVVNQIREYKALGYAIVIYSARNMRTHGNSVGLINAHTLPIIIEWLQRNDIPYDEIHVGKPWCGTEGFYVDDRAVRPSEFVSMTLAEILTMIGKTGHQPLASSQTESRVE